MPVSDLGGVARFSIDSLPERDRMAYWRESFGRQVMGLDMEPAEEEPLHFEITRHRLGDIAVISARTSGHRARRTPDLLTDDNSDQVLVMPSHRNVVARARGREVMVRPGQAFLMGLNEPGCAEQPPAAGSARPESFVHIQFPREVLAPLVPNLDDLMLAMIPEQSEALRLLSNYVRLINGGDRFVTEHTAHSVATHILDLAVLAIGGSRDATVQARRRGLGAARLASIKAYVRARAGDPGLTVMDAARHSGISPGYVWRLFAREGESFSGYLLEQRLQRARHMLASPAFAQFRISAIAYKAGFGDLSYFNRAFRRRFAATPSAVRADGAA
jgi:AraC-like DNA-binding protein